MNLLVGNKCGELVFSADRNRNFGADVAFKVSVFLGSTIMPCILQVRDFYQTIRIVLTRLHYCDSMDVQTTRVVQRKDLIVWR